MNKEKIFSWIESLEYQANQSNNYFIERNKLYTENQQLKDNWNKMKEELCHLRHLTFSKYNSNEWNNCLSFNDDILPIIKEMQKLEKGDSNEM